MMQLTSRMVLTCFIEEVFYNFFIIKNVVLSRAKDYYENNKDRLREPTRDKYRNLSE